MQEAKLTVLEAGHDLQACMRFDLTRTVINIEAIKIEAMSLLLRVIHVLGVLHLHYVLEVHAHLHKCQART